MNSKFKFSAVAFGVALATTSLSALADPPANPAAEGMKSIVEAEAASVAPTFNTTETSGLALVESALSLIAAHTDHYGCPVTSPRRFALEVNSYDAYTGEAEAIIDDGDVTLSGILVGQNKKGVLVKVSSAKGDALKRAGVVYTGNHAWNPNRSIFLDSAYIDLTDTQNGAVLKYDEHSIKDYFKRVEGIESWEYDWGLEVITKNDYPRAKWTELSWYHQENGGDGYLKVVKKLIKPGSAAGCKIMYVADGYNAAGEFQYTGEVTVQVASNSSSGSPQ